jgi:hypothetical protein
MHFTAYIKITIGALLACNALSQLFTHTTWWFIQNVNLIFHEAGHMFLMFFGDTLHTLGGSIFEIGVPLTIMLYFFATQQYFSATFCAWWLSTAFLSVSIYAADAREQALPLLGGNAVYHDWHTLLQSWGLLRYDDTFGYIFWLCGLGAVFLLLYFLYRDKSVMLLLNKYFDTNHETHLSKHRR